MNRQNFVAAILFSCLLLTQSACGNKGPLVPAEEEQQKKEQPQTENGAE